MSHAVALAHPGVEKADRSFLWRRLHSLSGAHLGNATLMKQVSLFSGPHIFARVAQRRVRVVGWLLFAALSAVTLNILFQMRYGA